MIEKQRLIDAAALIEQVKGIPEGWTTDEVIDLLTFAPVIEARPMVRCKDCAFYSDHWCYEKQHGAHEDGFCDEGRNKNG